MPIVSAQIVLFTVPGVDPAVDGDETSPEHMSVCRAHIVPLVIHIDETAFHEAAVHAKIVCLVLDRDKAIPLQDKGVRQLVPRDFLRRAVHPN